MATDFPSSQGCASLCGLCLHVGYTAKQVEFGVQLRLLAADSPGGIWLRVEDNNQ